MGAMPLQLAIFLVLSNAYLRTSDVVLGWYHICVMLIPQALSALPVVYVLCTMLPKQADSQPIQDRTLDIYTA